MYRAVDAVLIRAAAYPACTRLPAWPGMTGSTADHTREWRSWLAQVWANDWFTEAVEAASPVLAGQVCKALDGSCADLARLRRIVTSVARYLLRATGRATPFGLFSGAAPAGFGDRLDVQWGSGHRVTARPAAGWLAATVSSLEACPALLRRLPVVVSNLCQLRGDRLVVTDQQHIGSCGDDAGAAGPVEVSVRRTPVVEAALQYARTPIVAGDLAGKLAAGFPQAPEAAIERMLAELVRLRLLLTSLRPPMTATDPLGHLTAQLAAADADAVPQIAERLRELCAIQDEAARHDRARSLRVRRAARVRLAGRMGHAGTTDEPPVTVDTRLDARIILPQAVAREAEAAAAALTHLTPHPDGLPAWEDYHAAFLDRYGPSAVVPVLELVNPGTGLGVPATYRGSARTLPPPAASARDERLAALAQKTILDGGNEITLDDQLISHLAGGDAAARLVPPHAELFVQIHAPTRAAIERGEFEFVVTGASRAAGTTAGRFLDLLEPADRDRIARAYAVLPAARMGALAVQVSCPPVHAQSEAVARAPAVLPDVISVAEHPAPGRPVIPLEDLAVTGDADGLYLVSLRQGRPVEPTVLNAVEFRTFSHPLARFLCEIPRARAAVYMPFTWGAAGSLPFLPRIRYGRTVLAPARWNLPAADLPGRNVPWAQWQQALGRWRQHFRVPAPVYLGEADNLLPLDIGQDMHQALLRSHLDRRGHATLLEAPGPGAFGWLDGRPCEVAIPLASTRPAAPAPFARAARSRVTCRDHGQLPGCTQLLSVKIYGHPDRQADVLTRIPDLLAAWPDPPQWWYLRYRDPEPHLRLRFHLPDPGLYGPAVNRIGAWVARLRSLGLAGRMELDTYYPETGRYGTGAAMAAAESVFAADSAAALTQITWTASGGPHPDAVTAASLADIAAAFTGSTADGMHWLASHIPREPAPARPSRPVYAEAMQLADPSRRHAILDTSPGGRGVAAAWRRRAAALAAHRDELTAAQQVPVDSVLASLLHLHDIRAAGTDPAGEQLRHHLARCATVGWIARSKEART